MKIELKLTADHINFLAALFEKAGKVTAHDVVTKNIQSKALISILIDIADKFADKFKKISRKPTIFDAKKRYTVSMKYHEAYAIGTYLHGITLNETNDHNRHMAEVIKNQINEKLT